MVAILSMGRRVLGLNKMANIMQTAFLHAFFFHFFVKISPNSVPSGPINYESQLFQEMAWHQTGDKPLAWTKNDPVACTLTHVYFTGPK